MINFKFWKPKSEPVKVEKLSTEFLEQRKKSFTEYYQW
jgi:hypothetical protein